MRLLALLGLIGCLVLATGDLHAQQFEPFPDAELAESETGEADEIETDRDSFTPATTVAGHRRAIVEAAHTFLDNRAVPETHSFPELIVRYGANDWLELRVGWNYEVGGAGSPVSGNVPSDFEAADELEREARLLYGFKAALTAQEGWVPQSAFLLQGFTPTEGAAHDTDFVGTYVFGWTLPNNWVWDTALRASTGSLDDDSFQVWAPSTVLKVPLGERWKAHVEYFSVFSHGREIETTQHYFSPGAHYLITENLEVGARIGWGLSHDAPNFFSNVGVGWRY